MEVIITAIDGKIPHRARITIVAIAPTINFAIPTFLNLSPSKCPRNCLFLAGKTL
jgi:hypothetical protein